MQKHNFTSIKIYGSTPASGYQNMNRKNALTLSTLLIIIIGIAILFIPFASSFLPSEKVVSTSPRIDLSVINKGEYKYYPNPVRPEYLKNYKWAVLVYRKYDGLIKLWDVPIKNGKVGLPDIRWFKPIYDCNDFGPTLVSGKVDESKPIKCHDTKQLSEWWANEWRWDIEGKSLGSMVSNLHKTKGYQQGKEFIFK